MMWVPPLSPPCPSLLLSEVPMSVVPRGVHGKGEKVNIFSCKTPKKMPSKKVNLRTTVKLPEECGKLPSGTSSYLTFLDTNMPPMYIFYVWVYGPKYAVDFDTLLNATKKLLQDENYATVLTARYVKEKDGRWLRTEEGLKHTVWVISGLAPDVEVEDDRWVGMDDLPKGLFAVKPDAMPDQHTGELYPTPSLCLQHTLLGSNGACALTMALHHNIADSSAFFNLANDLAAYCRGENPARKVVISSIGEFATKSTKEIDISKPPNIGLTYNKPVGPLWFRNALSWLIRRPDSIVYNMQKHLFMKLYKPIYANVSKEVIDGFKAKAASKVSSNDILTGIFFWSLIKTRYEKCRKKSKFPEKSHFLISYSLQKEGRIEPPFPADYFGNAVILAEMNADTKDLIIEDVTEVVLKMAALCRSAVEKMSESDAVDEYLAFSQAKERKDVGIPIKVIMAENMVISSNWCAFHAVNPRFSAKDDGSDEKAVLYSETLPKDPRTHLGEGFFFIRFATQGRSGFDFVSGVKNEHYETLISNLAKCGVTINEKSFK